MARGKTGQEKGDRGSHTDPHGFTEATSSGTCGAHRPQLHRRTIWLRGPRWPTAARNLAGGGYHFLLIIIAVLRPDRACLRIVVSASASTTNLVSIRKINAKRTRGPPPFGMATKRGEGMGRELLATNESSKCCVIEETRTAERQQGKV